MSEIRSSPRPLGNKLEASLLPIGALLIAVVLWFLAALCAGRFLIIFPPAQELFITTLATLGWSGTTIYLMVGALLGVISLIQMLGWPRSTSQRLIQRRLGLGMARVVLIGWIALSLLEITALAFGFERLAAGSYINALMSLGLPPLSVGMGVLSVLVALVLSLAPEWLALRAIQSLYMTWFQS
jgi:hypothetical protein